MAQALRKPAAPAPKGRGPRGPRPPRRPPAPPRRKLKLRRIAGLDGLRVVGALGVVLYHTIGAVLASNHWIAVIIAPAAFTFFIVSGFVIYRPFVAAHATRTRPPSTRNFFQSRFVRVLPMWWLAVAVYLLIDGTGSLHGAMDWFLTLSLLHYVDPDIRYAVIGPTWALSAEWIFYLLTPGLAWLMRRGHRAIAPKAEATDVELVVLGALGVMCAVIPPLRPFIAILIGMAFGVLDVRRELRKQSAEWIRLLQGGGVTLVVSLVGWWVLAAYPYKPGLSVQWVEQDARVLAIWIGVAVFWFIPVAFGPNTGPVTSRLGTPFAVRLSQFTFGIYIWHDLVLRHAIDRLGLDGTFMPILYLTTLGGLALAVFTYVAVERPCMAWRASWAGSGSGRPDALARGQALRAVPATPVTGATDAVDDDAPRSAEEAVADDTSAWTETERAATVAVAVADAEAADERDRGPDLRDADLDAGPPGLPERPPESALDDAELESPDHAAALEVEERPDRPTGGPVSGESAAARDAVARKPAAGVGRGWITSIDGLRVLAAICVVGFHVGAEKHLSARWSQGLAALCIPVFSTFFVVSGFVLYRPWAMAQARLALEGKRPERAPDGGARNFWLRRALRVYPLYWLVQATAIAVSDTGLPHGLSEWFQIITLFPLPDFGVIVNHGLGVIVWTMVVELTFYAVLPGIGRFITSQIAGGASYLKAQALPLGSLAVVLAFFGSTNARVLGVAVCIVTGMMFAAIDAWQRTSGRWVPGVKPIARQPILAVPVTLASWFIGAAVARHDDADLLFRTHLGVHLGAMVLVSTFLFVPAVMGSARSGYRRFLSSKPMLVLGPLTYGIYLWHYPVIRQTGDRIDLPLPVLLVWAMFAAVTLAFLTYRFVEMPSERLRHARLGRTSSPSPSPIASTDPSDTRETR